MNAPIILECPSELLVSMRLTAQELTELARWETAIALFRQGRLSSGRAAEWIGVPRQQFLLRAMAEGAVLLEDSPEELRRESGLLP